MYYLHSFREIGILYYTMEKYALNVALIYPMFKPANKPIDNQI